MNTRTAAITLLALSLGCDRAALQGGDAGVDRASDLVSVVDAQAEIPARCQGSVDVSGTTPEGAFQATSVRSEITIQSSSCRFPGVRIFLRGAGDSGFDIHVEATNGDGGATLAPGDHTATVLFYGTRQTSPQLFITSKATLHVTSSDAPPIQTCATWNLSGNPIAPSISGQWSGTLTMSQDGFSIGGTLTVPYCTCAPCPDSV